MKALAEIRGSGGRFAGLTRAVVALVLLCLATLSSLAEQRFPPPDFVETNHQIPATATPGARALWLQYGDIVVLAAALGVALWLIYRRRSRPGLVWLSLFSMAYFGFYRNGCICSIGSLQNVSLALADPSYSISWTALAFFVLPLAVALFSGRAFCAGVCPHGALQDLLLLKPLKVPAWLEHGLGILPFVYLGIGVLLAATGSLFVICEYDPFIPIFRLSGRAVMVGAGAGFVLLSVFVGRPYCRFLCPYGALLKLGAIVAKGRVRVTPDTCTQCRLCEHSCPFGAMREPESPPVTPAALAGGRRRLALALVLVPVLILAGAGLGSRLANRASLLNPTVALAARLSREAAAPVPTGPLSPDDFALARARENPRALTADATAAQRRFAIGTPLFGGWLGLVVGAKLLSLALHRRRSDYEPDRGSCFGCARCFEFCPNELVRRGLTPAAALPALPTPRT